MKVNDKQSQRQFTMEEWKLHMRSVIKFIFPLSHVMYFDICSGIRMGLCRVHISKFKFFRYLIFVKVLEAVFYIKLYFRLVPVLRNLCQVFFLLFDNHFWDLPSSERGRGKDRIARRFDILFYCSIKYCCLGK